MNNPSHHHPQDMRRPNDVSNVRSSKKVRHDDLLPPSAADDDMLTLSLSIPPRNLSSRDTTPPPPPPPPPILVPQSPSFLPNIPMPLQLPPSHSVYQAGVPWGLGPPPPPPSPPVVAHHARPPRLRRNTTQNPKQEGKSPTVPQRYPWATEQRATVHSLEHLSSRGIETITGDVQCKRCEKQYEVGFNLREKFAEVGTFIAENKGSMHDRAPAAWLTPVLPTCRFCQQENSARPVLAQKKREINWLFLLLGQMLGCCTLEQLKYFCKHTKNHRTGAKDRVLYLTYLALCKQLDPKGPFDR